MASLVGVPSVTTGFQLSTVMAMTKVTTVTTQVLPEDLGH